MLIKIAGPAIFARNGQSWDKPNKREMRTDYKDMEI